MTRARWRLGLGYLLLAQVALAQPEGGLEDSEVSLTRRIGVEAARELLSSREPARRRLGLERLSSIRSARALELLVETLEPGGQAQSPRERLVATHALASYAPAHPEARRALVRIMTGVGSATADSTLEPLVRKIAGLALSACGAPDAYTALGSLLRQRGPVAALARDALIAHPPRSLDPLMNAPGAASAELVQTLESLGDQRAFDGLRALVTQASPEVRANAAVALTRLGHLETVDLARHWLAHEGPLELTHAALEILMLTKTKDAAQAWVRAWAQEPRPDTLQLARWSRDAALVDPLLTELKREPPTSSIPVLSALAGIATPRALSALFGRLAHPEVGLLAAHALALSESDAAGEALERGLALKDERALRHAFRGLVMRERLLGRKSNRAREMLARLAASKKPAERAIAAWSSYALSEASPELRSNATSPEVRAAALRATFDREAARVAASELRRRRDPRDLAALAIALIHRDAALLVPNVALEALLALPAAAPIAVLELARRDAAGDRSRVAAWLASGDPDIRSSSALGLGWSPHADAVGRLSEAWLFEPDARVRRAVLQGLALRREPTRARTLHLAERLDPDPANRALARRALLGVAPGVLSSELGVAAVATAPHQAARVRLDSGLTLPVVADPDGVIVVFGLSRSGVSVIPVLGP